LRTLSQRFADFGLLSRVVAFAVLLTVELGWASLAFDGATLTSQPGILTHLLAAWAARAVRFLFVFLAIAATFSFLDRRDRLVAFSRSIGSPPLRWSWFALHVAATGLCGWTGVQLYGGHAASPDLLVIATLASAVVAGAAVALWLLPAVVWKRLLAIPREIWTYAVTGGVAVILG